MSTTRLSIHVWHLEMTTKPQSATTSATDSDSEKASDSERNYELHKATTPLPELNRFLYATVGAACMWYMRLSWNYQQWSDYLSNTNIETWVAYQGATPIGYFELERQAMGTAEIVYFGLVPEFVGKGLGRQLLTDAIAKAWAIGEKRIWLHTCTLDHPNALPNYLNRGFKIFKEEEFEDDIPSVPLQPWIGANKAQVRSES